LQSKVRAGFLGGGRISDLNAVGWLEHPDAEIAAVCDIDAGVAERRASEWGARPYGSYEEMLADESVDAVEILTPHHLHVEQAIAALEAGKHVSLQKPPAVSIEEYDRMAEAVAEARRRGQIFRVYENFMWYPPHRLARQLIDEGAIGSVISVHMVTAAGRMTPGQGWEIPMSTQSWRLDRNLCGGGMATFDHGFHCFQLARYFVDEPVDRVHAFINFLEIPGVGEVDAPAVISWRYESGSRMGSWVVAPSLDLEIRSRYYVSDDKLEIRGSSGIIWVTRCTGELLEEPALTLYRDGVTRSFHHLETDWSSSFRDCTFDFIEAVKDGRDCPLDVGEARKTLAFAIAAQISGRQGREVKVSEVLDEGSAS
jgi:predicted dehydrogenase